MIFWLSECTCLNRKDCIITISTYLYWIISVGHYQIQWSCMGDLHSEPFSRRGSWTLGPDLLERKKRVSSSSSVHTALGSRHLYQLGNWNCHKTLCWLLYTCICNKDDLLEKVWSSFYCALWRTLLIHFSKQHFCLVLKIQHSFSWLQQNRKHILLMTTVFYKQETIIFNI